MELSLTMVVCADAVVNKKKSADAVVSLASMF